MISDNCHNLAKFARGRVRRGRVEELAERFRREGRGKLSPFQKEFLEIMENPKMRRNKMLRPSK